AEGNCRTSYVTRSSRCLPRVPTPCTRPPQLSRDRPPMQPAKFLRVSLLLFAASLSACGGGQARYAHHIERGKQYLEARDLDKAGVEFRNALQIEPKSPEALYLNGVVAERRADLRSAMSLYQAAIEAQTDQQEARAALGKLWALAGAPDRALEVVKPALA